MTAHKRRHATQPFALCKLSYIVSYNIFHFFDVIVHGLLHRAGLSAREEAQIQPAHVI